MEYIYVLVQDCCNSSALAVELLQSCTKPPIAFSMHALVYKDSCPRDNTLPDHLDNFWAALYAHYAR